MTLKPRTTRAWGISKDTEDGNTYTFHALTLGQLYAISYALKHDTKRTAVGDDVLIQVDRAIESAELAYR